MDEIELKKVCDEILVISDFLNATTEETNERNEDNSYVAEKNPTDPIREPGEQFDIRVQREHGKAWQARVTRSVRQRNAVVVTVARGLVSLSPAAALLSLLDVLKVDLRHRRDAAARFI